MAFTMEEVTICTGTSCLIWLKVIGIGIKNPDKFQITNKSEVPNTLHIANLRPGILNLEFEIIFLGWN